MDWGFKLFITRSADHFLHGEIATVFCSDNFCIIDIEAKFYQGKIRHNEYAMAHEIGHILHDRYPKLFADPHEMK